MKKLFFNPNIGEFDITDPKTIFLIIENPKSFWKFGQYLYDKLPDHIGYCSLLIDGKEKAIDEVSLFMANPYDLDINSKSNLNALYKMLKKEYFNDLSEGIDEISKKIEKICESIRLDFDAEIEMSGQLKIDDLFKVGNLRFVDDCETILEKLTKFISISNELQGIDVVFINQLSSFLNVEELKSFLKELHYRGITLVNVESNQILLEKHKDIEAEKLIIDSDLCSISGQSII